LYNVEVLELLESVKHMYHNDYCIKKSNVIYKDFIKKSNFNKEEVFKYSEHYKGKRYVGFKRIILEAVKD
jgi:hypothetical protein